MEDYQGDNIGGVKSVELIEHYNVIKLNPLTLVPGKIFKEILSKEETGHIDPTEKDSDNGIIYGYRGDLFFHRMRDEVTALMKPYIGQTSIMRVKDMNNRTYIIGAPGAPVTITSSGSTGARYATENGIRYSFEIDQSFPAIITD
ncbi:hypothetical protein [Pedobacter ginsengisoli]|uniref:hypothetical protein n=1 Tax=Pedobacter ginsengisoli TaxID=363852 RepID=UPI00254F7CFF|nr:hypothetical protein [Pedobacter ginsengisoli]